MGSGVSFPKRQQTKALRGQHSLPVTAGNERNDARDINMSDSEGPLTVQTDSTPRRDDRRSPTIGAFSTQLQTPSPPRRAPNSQSTGSSRGPNSRDSHLSSARDAVDILYRRTQMSDAGSPLDSDNGGAADVFVQTAMSLGLDNEDLLFNMMFFDDGQAANFGAMINTMQQETLALHSENNTPYKLNPAKQESVSALLQEVYCCRVDVDNECQVCKDEIEEGSDISRIPSCRHYFHVECLLRWIQLQGWCPVCRTSLDAAEERSAGLLERSKMSTCVEEDEEQKEYSSDAKVHQSATRRLDFDTVALDSDLPPVAASKGDPRPEKFCKAEQDDGSPEQRLARDSASTIITVAMERARAAGSQ